MSFRDLIVRLKNWLQPAPRQLMIGDWSPAVAPARSFAGSAPQPDTPGDPAPPVLLQRISETGSLPGHASRSRIFRAFNSSLPVEDRYGLSGRKAEIDALAEGILSERKHGIVFGSRGSGKTSLARVFGDLADEADCTVIYSSVSSDLSFADLFRPYLEDLPGADRSGTVRRLVEGMKDAAFDVRTLAGLLVEVRSPTVLVLDEFDLIRRVETKHEVANLLKLLTDMHAKVRVLLIGIAGNVDDLLAGHPSLRRHIVAVPIGPIAKASVTTLIANCADDAGVTIAGDAQEMLTAAAIGSPYHARLFGLQAALAANARGATQIGVADVGAGFAVALNDWAGMSGETYRIVRAVLDEMPDAPVLLGSIVAYAAFCATFTPTFVVRLCDEDAPRPDGWEKRLAILLDRLAPILHRTVNDDALMLEDTLSPQFIRLMMMLPATGPTRAVAAGTDLPEDFRATFRGLKLS